MRVFLSHAAADQTVAGQLKAHLERALPGVQVFASSAGDIQLGDEWLRTLTDALAGAALTLVLCSRRSVGRPWVNFESGAGWASSRRVITVCVGGVRAATLPTPLQIFQGIDLYDAASCGQLAEDMGKLLGASVADDFDPDAMLAALDEPPPAVGRVIGVVRAHGQDRWQTNPTAAVPFNLPSGLPPALERRWEFRRLGASTDLRGRAFRELAGLVLGMPFRRHMPAEDVQAIVDWVRDGGRLLLLGYELGDRHHDGNLGELSRHFGIHPLGDIVAPAGVRHALLYGTPVHFSPADARPHAFTAGLGTLQLTNVQTLHAEPGGIAWLRAGANVVYRPTRESVVYQEGVFTQPYGKHFDQDAGAREAAVAVEAPRGLCGQGGVHAIGTWDVLGFRAPLLPDNVVLLERLFDWLSGAGEPGTPQLPPDSAP